MIEKKISRRGAFSLLGIAATFGLGVPTTMLTMSDAEAQAPPTAPASSTPAPSAPATSASAPSTSTSGMNRRQARRAGRHARREARRHAREMRREARHGKNIYMKSNTTKQQ
jgi:pyruvate/2-oxoglutarate dehydrogenase complex dihydrolipoamide acyltransferase (E2) component